MQFRLALVPITAALLLTGCSSSKSANKSNFAKAINTALAKNCIAINPRGTLNAYVSGTQYPVGVEEVKASDGFLGRSQTSADKTNARNFGRFDALVKAGLLTSSSGKVKNSITHKPVPGKTYALTPVGKKALQRQDYTSFCAGHWQVKEVTNFTEPGKAMNGATMSTVQFTYGAADVPEWTAKAIDAGYPGLRKELDTSGKGRANLVLTNNGWEAHIGTLNAQ